MTTRTGIRDFVLIRHSRRDEFEGVAPNKIVRQCLLDFWHVAGQAVVTRTGGLVMRMRLQARCMRPVRRIGTMAFQAHQATGLDEIGIVFGAVCVMAGSASNPSSIHQALDEVIPLHAILVCGAVGKVRESGFTQLVLFQLPEVL